MEKERIKHLEAAIQNAVDDLKPIPRKLDFLRSGYLENADAEAFADIAVAVFPSIVNWFDERLNDLQKALEETEPQET